MDRRREYRRAARARGLTVEEWRVAVADEAAASDRCAGCGRLAGPPWMAQGYLWELYGVGPGLLCLSCFEGYMGRRVQAHDLTICGANLTHPRARRIIAAELRRWGLAGRYSDVAAEIRATGEHGAEHAALLVERCERCE